MTHWTLKWCMKKSAFEKNISSSKDEGRSAAVTGQNSIDFLNLNKQNKTKTLRQPKVILQIPCTKLSKIHYCYRILVLFTRQSNHICKHEFQGLQITGNCTGRPWHQEVGGPERRGPSMRPQSESYIPETWTKTKNKNSKAIPFLKQTNKKTSTSHPNGAAVE